MHSRMAFPSVLDKSQFNVASIFTYADYIAIWDAGDFINPQKITLASGCAY